MDRTFLKHAGIGAGAMVLSVFVPFVGFFAPLIGGAVASWLDGADSRRGAKLGAASGAIVSLLFLPLLLIGAFLALFDSGITLVILFALTLIVTALVTGLGALGGYLGSVIADAESTDTQDEGIEHEEKRDTIEDLQRRYADGELTEAELEAELDRVLDDGSDDDRQWGSTDVGPETLRERSGRNRERER